MTFLKLKWQKCSPLTSMFEMDAFRVSDSYT